MAITLLVSGLFFTVFNLFSMSANYADFLNRSQVIFFLTAPLLTMRLFTAEKASKTDQLLLTAPVSNLSIVLGKILAATVLFAITFAFFVLYLVVLGLLGFPDWTHAWGGLLGYVLLGFSLICLGGFISTCTENPLSAAIISFATIFLFWLLPAFSGMLPSHALGQFIASSLSFLSLSSRYESFYLGIILWANVAYYLAFSAFFILVSSYNLKQYNLKKCLNLVLTALILIMTVLVLQKLNWQTDITEEKIFSLNPQTITLLENLEEPTTITFLANDKDMTDTQFRQIDAVLQQYKYYGKTITYQVLDPISNPAFLSRFTAEGDPLGSAYIIVSNAQFFKIINPVSLVSYNINATGVPKPTSLNVESLVTGAIEFVGNGKTSHIYALTGHGETPLYEMTIGGNNFTTALENDNYLIQPFTMAVNKLPTDADLIVIINPLNDISLYEQEQLSAYLNKGGRLFVNLELSNKPFVHLNRLLENYGIQFKRNSVAEFNNQALIPALNGNNWFFIAQLPHHPINQPLISRGATVLVGETMNLDTIMLHGTNLSPLLQSSNKTKINYLTDTNQTEQMVDKQATVALLAERPLDNEKIAKMLVFTGRLDLLLQADGTQWLLNAINYLNQTEGKIYIENKGLYQLPLKFNGLLPVLLLGFVFVIVVPLTLLLMALVIYVRRKSL